MFRFIVSLSMGSLVGFSAVGIDSQSCGERLKADPVFSEIDPALLYVPEIQDLLTLRADSSKLWTLVEPTGASKSLVLNALVKKMRAVGHPYLLVKRQYVETNITEVRERLGDLRHPAKIFYAARHVAAIREGLPPGTILAYDPGPELIDESAVRLNLPRLNEIVEIFHVFSPWLRVVLVMRSDILHIAQNERGFAPIRDRLTTIDLGAAKITRFPKRRNTWAPPEDFLLPNG